MYRPLPSYLTIKPSEIEGLGLFTTDDIDNKHVLGISHVYDVRFPDSFIRTPLGGFFNHSQNPNCEIIRDDKYLKLKAIRDIKAGEEITVRYTLYDPTKL